MPTQVCTSNPGHLALGRSSDTPDANPTSRVHGRAIPERRPLCQRRRPPETLHGRPRLSLGRAPRRSRARAFTVIRARSQLGIVCGPALHQGAARGRVFVQERLPTHPLAALRALHLFLQQCAARGYFPGLFPGVCHCSPPRSLLHYPRTYGRRARGQDEEISRLPHDAHPSSYRTVVNALTLRAVVERYSHVAIAVPGPSGTTQSAALSSPKMLLVAWHRCLMLSQGTLSADIGTRQSTGSAVSSFGDAATLPKTAL